MQALVRERQHKFKGASDGGVSLPPSFSHFTLTGMSYSEQTPLLNGNSRNLSLYPKMVSLLKAEGEPSWLDSYKWFIFGSWSNLLLLLIPVAAAAHYLSWDAPLRFGFSFVAIIPLARVRNFSWAYFAVNLTEFPPQLLGDATEEMSLSLGQTLAGLLNATFGNAVEIIVGLVALLEGEVRIVQTSVCNPLHSRTIHVYYA